MTVAPEGPPELSGRLELGPELGRGGFARVHRARERDSGREVALKLLHVERAGTAASLTRFYREGELAARLVHPGIVRVHAAGTFRGQPCLVYELIEAARPLSEALPLLTLERRLEVVRDVARALGWAHARGVVHRDVKPENVLVDPQGRARLTDFGLAAAGDLERLTRSGAVLGTPHYMAPEQLRGSREEVGPRSDVWALGVMLYQALTDQLPLSPQGLAALAAGDGAAGVVPPRRVRPDVPPGLETVCLHALERSPADRYPHATALAEDLERVLAGGAPLARRRARWPRRAVWLLPLLPLAAAVGLVLSQPRQPSSQAAPAEPSADAPIPRSSDQAWEDLRREPDPWARGRLATAWLEANPRHPRAGEAQRLVSVARGGLPLHRFEWPSRKQRPVFVEGTRFVSCGKDRRVRGGDAVSGATLPSWSGLRGTVAAAHPRVGLFVGDEGEVQRWDLVPAQAPRSRFPCAGRPEALAVAPGAGLLAVGVDQRVEVHGLEGSAPVASLAMQQWVACLDFSPDERLLVVGGAESSREALGLPSGWLLAFEVPGLRPRWQREELDGYYCLRFAPGGALFGGSRSCLLPQVDPRTGETVRYLEGQGLDRNHKLLAELASMAHSLPVHGLAVSPDGRRLYSVASAIDQETSELGVWELPGGRPVGPVIQHRPYRFSSLDIDASGRVLLIGTDEGVVLSWLTPP